MIIPRNCKGTEGIPCLYTVRLEKRSGRATSGEFRDPTFDHAGEQAAPLLMFTKCIAKVELNSQIGG